MENVTVKPSWNEQKEKLKKKYAFLIESDLMFEVGMKDEMLSNLQKKLGKTKEEVLSILSAL